MKQTITQLRGICQNLGVKWSFADDELSLKQKISIKQEVLMPPAPAVAIPLPEDQRLRTKPPSKISLQNEVVKLLQPYTERGLKIEFTEDGQQFNMSYANKTDSGTMRQPPRVLIDCARRLLE